MRSHKADSPGPKLTLKEMQQYTVDERTELVDEGQRRWMNKATLSSMKGKEAKMQHLYGRLFGW